MFNKVKSVKPLDNFVMLITFENGKKKYYDIKTLINKFSVFKDLIDINGLFEQVKVDIGGYGIYWNDDIDLSCNELWNNGKLKYE